MWDTILCGQQWQGELVNRRKDGRLYPEEMTITPVRNGTGEITHFIAIKLDITERKLAEESLRRSEERLRLAQRAAGLGIYELELPSGRRTWSPHLFEIFGLPADSPQHSAEDSLRFTHPDDRPLVEQESALLFAGMPIRFDHRIIRPDGEVRWVEFSGKGEFDRDGKPVRCLGVCRDITENKQLEAQLRQAQKMEAVGQLAGGVAHDFNNVLGIIGGNVDLLSERIPPDEICQKYLERVRMAVKSATAVTGQLLAFSRKQILQPVILDLNTVVRELNKMTYRLIGENIRVVLALEPDLGLVKADRGQIEHALMNLAVNARDAMPDGGKLFIRTANVHLDQDFVKKYVGSVPGDFIKLVVTDTGCGMTKDVLAHIFEPFFTTKGVGKGTGLGLATVYGIVKQSEGHICVESKPGAGTTFEIYLPRVQRAATVVRPAKSANFAWGSETILLVEDEPFLREVTRIQLEKLGYQVLEAADAEQALRLFDDHGGEVSLLLTDVIMPGMDGHALGDHLRHRKPGLRILYMSGYTDDETLREHVSESIQAILIKPFPFETLATRVREILDGAPRTLKH
jgi:PAS domain S-box-containing protein